VYKNEGMTVSDLKQHVEDWMSTKFQVTLKYDPTEAIKQLENFGLLVTKQRGMPQPVLMYFYFQSLLFSSHFNAFSLFEHANLKRKYSIITIVSKMIVSLSFVQKILNNFNTYCEMINSVISIGPNSKCTMLSYSNCLLLFKLYFVTIKSSVS